MSEKPELSKLLIMAGYCPRVAKALAWLIMHGEGIVTSREIERGADLRQPEVNYATTILSGTGWLEITKTQSTSKPGRPFMQYQIRMNREQSYAAIKQILDKKIEDVSSLSEKIRETIIDKRDPELKPASS